MPLGPIFLLGLLVICAVIISLVHALARPSGTGDLKPSDALRDLEPRGGRHRFSVRTLERFLVVVVWWTCIGVMLSNFESSTTKELFFLAVSFLFLLMGTWWVWHRGALRSPSAPPRTAGPASRLPQ